MNVRGCSVSCRVLQRRRSENGTAVDRQVPEFEFSYDWLGLTSDSERSFHCCRCSIRLPEVARGLAAHRSWVEGAPFGCNSTSDIDRIECESEDKMCSYRPFPSFLNMILGADSLISTPNGLIAEFGFRILRIVLSLCSNVRTSDRQTGRLCLVLLVSY